MFLCEPVVILPHLKVCVKAKNKLLGIASVNRRLYNEDEVRGVYAEQIRMHRQRLGLSQGSLGKIMGVSAVAVGKWERGLSQPDIDTLSRLADLFNISIDELCGRSPQPESAAGSNIHVVTRAFRQLTQDEQEKYIAVGRALFAHAFDREGSEGT